jgi:hypothetical protein
MAVRGVCKKSRRYRFTKLMMSLVSTCKVLFRVGNNPLLNAKRTIEPVKDSSKKTKKKQ